MAHKRHLWLLYLFLPVTLLGQSRWEREADERRLLENREGRWTFQVEFTGHFDNLDCFGANVFDAFAGYSPDDPSMGQVYTCRRALTPDGAGMLCRSVDLRQLVFPPAAMDARVLLRIRIPARAPAPALRVCTVRLRDGTREIPLAAGLVTTETVKRTATGAVLPMSGSSEYGMVDLGVAHVDPSSHLRVEIFWEGEVNASIDALTFERVSRNGN